MITPMDVVSGVIVAILFSTLLFSKKLHYFASGLFLVLLGVLPILYDYGKISLDVYSFPIYHYAAIFLILFAGKDLLREGWREKQSMLRWPSLLLAVIMIASVTIPKLHNMGAISFALDYPPIVDHVLYIAAGLFLIVGIFTLLATKEEV